MKVNCLIAKLGLLAVTAIIAVVAIFSVSVYAGTGWSDGPYQSKVDRNDFVYKSGQLGIGDITYNVDRADTGSQNFRLSVFNKFGLTSNLNENTRVIAAKSPYAQYYSMPWIQYDNGTKAVLKNVKNPYTDDSFYMEFGAKLSDELKHLAYIGHLQMQLKADLHSKIAGNDRDYAYAEIAAKYSNFKDITRNRAGNYTKNGWSDDISTGWVNVPQYTEWLMVVMRSINDTWHGNYAEVSDVRVYLRDAGAPTVNKVTAKVFGPDGSEVSQTTTVNNETKHRGKIGDTVRYFVEFDEPVRIFNTRDSNTIKLKLESKLGNTINAKFVAGYSDSSYYREGSDLSKCVMSGWQTYRMLVFEYLITDRTESGDGLQPQAKPEFLDLGLCSVFDPSFNFISELNIVKSWQTNNITVDDTKTKLDPVNYQDDKNGHFYPLRTDYYDVKYDTNGDVLSGAYLEGGGKPTELNSNNGGTTYADKYNQKQIFGVSDSPGMIFRVVLNEEILKDDLSDLKINLRILNNDADKTFTGKYVSAPLVGARILGTKAGPDNAINTGKTEMLFKYIPKAEDFNSQGLDAEQYVLEFDGSVGADNKFVFGKRIFSKTVRNISNLNVDPALLVVETADKTPLNSATTPIIVDTKAPVVFMPRLTDRWMADFSGNSMLITDASKVDGVLISLKYKDGDSLQPLYFGIGNQDPSYEKKSLHAAWDEVSKAYKVDLGQLKLPREEENQNTSVLDAEKYLIYSVTDKAGNVSTNENMLLTPLKLDISAPTVDSVDVTVSGNNAKVKYNVSDKGIGEISDFFTYKIEESSVGNASAKLPSGLSDYNGNSNTQTIDFAGEQGTRKAYQTWAKFSDTLNNTMPDFIRSKEIDIATRKFKLEPSDGENALVSDKHDVRLKETVSPEGSDYRYEVTYKWIPSGMSDSAVTKTKTVTLKPSDFIQDKVFAYNFSSAKEQIEWIEYFEGGTPSKKEFLGEMKLSFSAKMITKVQQGSEIKEIVEFEQGGTADYYYFDKTAPVITCTAKGNNTGGYNKKYKISVNITDDGSLYKNGIFTNGSNIGHNNGISPDTAGGTPKLYVLIGEDKKESEFTYAAYSGNNNFEIDFNDLDESLKGETKAYIKVVATDVFGNTAEYNAAEPILFDLAAPKIKSLTPKFKTGKTENTDYALYDEGSNLYILRSIPTVIDGVVASVTDNVASTMTTIFNSNNLLLSIPLTEKLFERTITYDGINYRSCTDMYFRGSSAYRFNVNVSDQAGNDDDMSIAFIEDATAPVILSVEKSDKLTNAEEIPITINFTKDAYEQPEDITCSFLGDSYIAELVSADENEILLKVKDNGSFTVKLTDRLGNTATTDITIDCFDREEPYFDFTYDTNPMQGERVKVGYIELTASDNRNLSGISAAIVPEGMAVTEDDYFNFVSPTEFFTNAVSMASIIPLPLPNSATSKSYRVNYSGLPSGVYDLYVRAEDSAGNKYVNSKQIYCKNEPASIVGDIEYHPVTPTGGQVLASFDTDSPAYIMYQGEDLVSENAAAVSANVLKKRREGYTYTFNGVEKHLTGLEAIERYSEIAFKNTALTEEEEYLVRLYAGNYYPKQELEAYTQILVNDVYKAPVNDLLDFIMNEMLIPYQFFNGSILDFTDDNPEWYFEGGSIVELYGQRIRRPFEYYYGEWSGEDTDSPDIDWFMNETTSFLTSFFPDCVDICGTIGSDPTEMTPIMGFTIATYPGTLEAYSVNENPDGFTEQEITCIKAARAVRRLLSEYSHATATIKPAEVYPELSAEDAEQKMKSMGRESMNKLLVLLDVTPAQSLIDTDLAFDLSAYGTDRIDTFDIKTDNAVPELEYSQEKKENLTLEEVEAGGYIIGTEIDGNVTRETELAENQDGTFTVTITTVTQIPTEPVFTDDELELIEKIQKARAKKADTLTRLFADRYLPFGIATSFKSEHFLSFKRNTNDELFLIDELGQSTPFNIKIENIYSDIAKIGNERISVKLEDGTEVVRTNAEKVKLEINLPSVDSGERDAYCYIVADGVFAEVQGGEEAGNITVDVLGVQTPIMDLIAAIPEINIPITETTRLLKIAEIELTDNDYVEYGIIDISMLAGDKAANATAKQTYLVNVFDREAPKADVVYRPQLNDSTFTTDDVVASLVNISDNLTSRGGIEITYNGAPVIDTDITFSSNGTGIFTLTDLAGNSTDIPVEVSCIDKGYPALTVKFYEKNKQGVLIDGIVTSGTEQDGVTIGGSSTYSGALTRDDIVAVVYADGVEYSKCMFNTNCTKNVSYTKTNGLSNSLSITVDKIDTSAPYLDGEPVYLTTDTTNQNVSVRFKVADNKDKITKSNLTSYSRLSVRDSLGLDTVVSTNLADISYDAATENFMLTFDYNGDATLVFTDTAGNNVTIHITVDNIDKVKPSVKSEERSQKKLTNKDVTVMLYPDEDAKYIVCDITDNVPTETDWNALNMGYTQNAAVCTFTDNTANLAVYFRDRAGNVSEPFMLTSGDIIDKTAPVLNAIVYPNKSLTTEGTLANVFGFATIELCVADTTSGDVYTGNSTDDTIVVTSPSNEKYYTVIKNGDYVFYYSDLAGNKNELKVTVNCIDSTAPGAMFTAKRTDTGEPYDLENGGWVKGGLDITVTPTDDEGAAYVMIGDSKKDNHSFSVNENGSYLFVVKDSSDNTATKQVSIAKIDNLSPVLTCDGPINRFFKIGEFDEAIKIGMEAQVTATDVDGNGKPMSGVSTKSTTIFDAAGKDVTDNIALIKNTPGDYIMKIEFADNVGNVGVINRKIKILGEKDLLIILNDEEILPGTQTPMNQGILELNVLNAEKTGKKIIYAFEKSEYYGAQLKGVGVKHQVAVGDTIKIDASKAAGLHTLLVQTEDRQTIVAYIFIQGDKKE